MKLLLCSLHRCCCEPRCQSILVGVSGVLVSLTALFYSVINTWPAVHVRTDLGSLLAFEYFNREIYNETGCGKEEAMRLDRLYYENYHGIKIMAIHACGYFFSSISPRWLGVSVMIAYALASLLLVAASCAYRRLYLMPWLLLHFFFTVLSIAVGFVFLLTFEPTLPLNLDENFDYDFDTALGRQVMDWLFYISSCCLKLTAFYVVWTFSNMLLPRKQPRVPDDGVDKAEQS